MPNEGDAGGDVGQGSSLRRHHNPSSKMARRWTTDAQTTDNRLGAQFACVSFLVCHPDGSALRLRLVDLRSDLPHICQPFEQPRLVRIDGIDDRGLEHGPVDNLPCRLAGNGGDEGA